MSVPATELVIDMTDGADFQLGKQLISNGDGTCIVLNIWDDTVTIISEKEAIQYWMRAVIEEHKGVTNDNITEPPSYFYNPGSVFMLGLNRYADHDEWAVAQMEAVETGNWDDMDEGYE